MTAPGRERPIHPDEIHRTALLAAHDGSQPTLQEALDAHARTGIIICADTHACRDRCGQAAVLTAVATAVRAFGTVVLRAEALDSIIPLGVYQGHTLADAAAREGAVLATNPPQIGDPAWPRLLIGLTTPHEDRVPAAGNPGSVVLRATWHDWIARVQTGSARADERTGQSPCVLAAIAAAALAVSEAFGATRARPGDDAGYRTITLNLWDPRPDSQQPGPALAYAPHAWWLVGLGHLGQAYAWVIPWLDYTQPTNIEIILQDTDRTTPANHSTGLITPRDSRRIRKTRLVAAALDHAGFDTRIIERRLDPTLRVGPAERHTALLGVDNLDTRRMISTVGWPLAVDVGLGSGADTFNSIHIRRFPGVDNSRDVPAWSQPSTEPTIPDTPAFTDLKTRDAACGVIELAGKAVGAAFVGAVAACLAITETIRELHGGPGFDILTTDLTTLHPHTAPATRPADVVSAPLN